MEWDTRMNETFDYIEANLLGRIDADQIAILMGQSMPSFQRTLSFVLNLSLTEYIRRRRMTLAALELQSGPVKVIDLAYRYGYESPEAFARAFKEVHGLSPTAARKPGARLSLYPRVAFHLTVEGEIEMLFGEDAASAIHPSKAYNWAFVDNAQLTPYDNCIATAHKWREAGLTDLLDLGCGLGQNAVYFARQGFRVRAVDISEYAVAHTRSWAQREGLAVEAAVGDMIALPYPDRTFDCLYAYHVISHTNAAGIRRTIAEIERVLRPGGEAYLSFCSKQMRYFTENRDRRVDPNTVVCQEEPEIGVPHFFADLEDVKGLLRNFDIERVKHTEYCSLESGNAGQDVFYYVNARLGSGRTA